MIKNIKWKQYTIYIVLIAALVAFALWSGTGEMARSTYTQLENATIAMVLASSLCLVVGFLGELSLGHAGFMCIGAFIGGKLSVILTEAKFMGGNELGIMFIALIVGGIAAAIVGFLVGLPALRLRGDYLAIVTLGCGEIIKNVITNLKITGGALGLNTRPIYSQPAQLLPFVAVLVLITVIVMMNLKRSRHGRAITAIRDNRIAAEATGINVTYYKLMVFVLAAFFAGMAGVIYGHALANVKAVAFDYNMSIEILVIVVLGGMGSVRGSVIAAIVLQALPELLREFSDYRMLLYSILLIVIMLLNSSPKFAELKGRWSIKNVITYFKAKKAGVAAGKEE